MRLINEPLRLDMVSPTRTEFTKTPLQRKKNFRKFFKCALSFSKKSTAAKISARFWTAPVLWRFSTTQPRFKSVRGLAQSRTLRDLEPRSCEAASGFFFLARNLAIERGQADAQFQRGFFLVPAALLQH